MATPEKKEQPELASLTIQELIRRQMTLRSYVSRYTKKDQKAASLRAKAQAQAKLAEYERQLYEVDEFLKGKG